MYTWKTKGVIGWVYLPQPGSHDARLCCLLGCIAFGAWLSSCKKQTVAWLHEYEKKTVSGEPGSLCAKRCTTRLVFFASATTKHVRVVTAQVTKQQPKTIRLDKCRYPIIAILHVSSLSHGSLALGYEPGWVDTETNHALCIWCVWPCGGRRRMNVEASRLDKICVEESRRDLCRPRCLLYGPDWR